MRYFIGDTETTGLEQPKACEIAFVEIDPYSLDILQSWQSLIDPQKPISEGASNIHGILDHHVLQEPTIEEFVEVVMKGRFEEPCTLIAHNVKFDKPMFEAVMNVQRTYCTLALARRMLPTGPENHKLRTLAEFLGIDPGESHRAGADVRTVHGLLKILVPRTGKDLLGLMNVPRHVIYEMPFGEFKGTPLMKIPRQYRNWLLTEANIDDDLRYSLMQLRAAEI